MRFFSFFAFLALFSAQAFAGFEWVAPTQPEVIVTSPSVAASLPTFTPAPIPTQVEPARPSKPALQPIEFDDDNMGNQPIPLRPVANSALQRPAVTAPSYPAQRDRVVIPSDAPMRVESNLNNASRLKIAAYPNESDLVATQYNGSHAPSPQPVAASHHFEIIEGFGSDVPLALALSQIVPPAFAYHFIGSVNPGMRISWGGSKPWNIVLDEALAPLGYGSHISGQTVQIGKVSR